MAAINDLRNAVQKVKYAGKVANRIWDNYFIDVMTITGDDRYVYSVTLRDDLHPTIEFAKMDRTTGRTTESNFEVITRSQALKMRGELEQAFWPETAR